MLRDVRFHMYTARFELRCWALFSLTVVELSCFDFFMLLLSVPGHWTYALRLELALNQSRVKAHFRFKPPCAYSQPGLLDMVVCYSGRVTTN